MSQRPVSTQVNSLFNSDSSSSPIPRRRAPRLAVGVVALSLSFGLCGCAATWQEGEAPPWTSSELLPPASNASLNFLGAKRTLDSIQPELEELGESEVYGLEIMLLPWPNLPFGIELGGTYGTASTDLFLGSGLGSATVGLDLLEVNAGLRWYLHRALPNGFPIEPFVAAGWSRVYALGDLEFDGDEFNVSDGASGFYWRVGVQFLVSRRVHVGIDYRQLSGVDMLIERDGIESVNLVLDHDQIGLFVGFRF